MGDDEGTTAPRPRPSLYAAIKLARLVLFVKNRFKAQIKSRSPPTEPSMICHRDSFKVRAFEDLSHAIKTRSRGGNNYLQPRCSHKKGRGLELGVSTLLHDLDSHTLSGDETLSTIAKKDELFLKYNAQPTAATNSLDGLRHILDLTTLLLERLRPSAGSTFARPRNNNSSNSCNGFKCDIFIANLEHLLLCLQQAAFKALIIGTLKSIHSDILHWHQYWQQRRQTEEGWFAEWPNGQRPLNTTWPWNVKPSLVILWGVCWMFYGYGDMTRKTRADPNDFRTRQPSQDLRLMPTASISASLTPQATTNGDNVLADGSAILNANIANIATWNNLGLNTANLQHPSASWLQSSSSESSNVSEFELPGYSNENYIFASPAGTSTLFPSQSSLFLPIYQGNRVATSAYQNFGNWLPFLDQEEPQILPTTAQRTQTQGRIQPYGFNQNGAPLNQERRTFEIGLGLEVPMRDYPSPHSDGSVQGTSHVSPSMPYQPSSAVESPENEGSTRSADLARNDDGQLYCIHKECASQPPVFARRCEYNKHMDKHNRPYVCDEPGCEKIQGFTYPGGLLRHQREVHRQHGGPKALCKCPHPDCKRSTGIGFSRKENLSEHLRRVHKPIDHGREPAVGGTGPASSTEVSPSSPPESRKRRRLGEDGEGESEGRDLQKQLKRLRKELQQKDDRLKKLEVKVKELIQGQKTDAS